MYLELGVRVGTAETISQDNVAEVIHMQKFSYENYFNFFTCVSVTIEIKFHSFLPSSE
jgi:hypothetical protein